MLSIDRNTVLKGPCLVVDNGTLITTTKGDVTLSPQKTVFGIDTSTNGKNTDQRLKDMFWKASFQPAGEITSATLAALFPYYSLLPGQSIFGASDATLQFITRETSNNSYVFQNRALTKMPDLNFASDKTILGNVEYSCIGKNNTPFNYANRFLTIGTASYPSDTYNSADVLTVPFTGSWPLGSAVPTGTATATEASPAVFSDSADGLVVGDTIVNSGYANAALNGKFTVASTPTSGTYTLYQYGTTTAVNNTVGADSGTFVRANSLDSFDTESGFTVTHNMTTTPKSTDNVGVYDMLFSSMDISAKGTPIGPTALDMLAALNVQGTSVLKGQSLAGEGRNLNLSGAGIYFRLTQAFLKDTPWLFSPDKNRIGVAEWMATRKFSGGAPVPLAAISTSPIS
jgi:hypothetical protein